MAQSPFPTPEELIAQQQAAAAGETDRLRQLVQEAFARQAPGGSAYSVIAPGFSSVAIQTVFAELEAAGWRPEMGGQRDRPGEIFIFPPRPGNLP